jgi:hypothetical protein
MSRQEIGSKGSWWAIICSAAVLASFAVYAVVADPLDWIHGKVGSPEADRYGRVLVKTDASGDCHEYAVDNRTHQLVDKGIIVCDPEQKARYRAKTKSEEISEAFSGRRPAGSPSR